MEKPPDAVGYNAEWQLLVNVSRQELGGDVLTRAAAPARS
jgi:hypothetical protein